MFVQSSWSLSYPSGLTCIAVVALQKPSIAIFDLAGFAGHPSSDDCKSRQIGLHGLNLQQNVRYFISKPNSWFFKKETVGSITRNNFRSFIIPEIVQNQAFLERERVNLTSDARGRQDRLGLGAPEVRLGG